MASILCFVVTAIGALALPEPAHRATGRRIDNIAYEITFDTALAPSRLVRVAMSFDVATPGAVELSLPAWTPGAYRVSHFARNVVNFNVQSEDAKPSWDKADHDTWRIRASAGRVRVSFDFIADTLNNAMAWSRPDFLLLNGTNVFLFPEGEGLDFPATVTVRTEPGWRVATGMRYENGVWRESSFHDLVDMPFFIGRFEFDSARIAGKWHRLATYPEGALSGRAREEFWEQVQHAVPAMAKVFQEVPWDNYTTLLIFDSEFPGGGALEHQNSHVGIYNPSIIGSFGLPLITAHEIFHAWNVKRMRPADLMPYRYDAPQPTPWLWVSEGITDYYADLALVRSGVLPEEMFYMLTSAKMATVEAAPPVALEDASLTAWIGPRDGTSGIYYPKGSLAGLLLDILIRDASANRSSLDAVMRDVYLTTWQEGRGFHADDWWTAVRRAAGGRSFRDDYARYIDGREPYPWSRVLPLAGMTLVTDSIRQPRLGISIQQDAGGVRVTAVTSGSMAERAGVRPGDYLLKVGGSKVIDVGLGIPFRRQFSKAAEGSPVQIIVRRGSETVTLDGALQFEVRTTSRVEPDASAGGQAARIRDGILTGSTDTG
jgi:predicted metalloprotease with PDZ domain